MNWSIIEEEVKLVQDVALSAPAPSTRNLQYFPAAEPSGVLCQSLRP